MFSYGDPRTKLSGPDATRRLESNSGAMRREVRRLRREGFNKAAEQLALGAAQARLNEIPQEGPRWKSRETKIAESNFANQQQEIDNRNSARLARVMNMGLAAEEKRLSGILNPTSSSTSSTTPVSVEYSSTDSVSDTDTTPTDTTPTGTTPTGTTPTDTTSTGVPPLLARPKPTGPFDPAASLRGEYGPTATSLVAKQGKINGMPSGEFFYKERQRLRETSDFPLGKMRSSELEYWKSMREKAELESRDRIKKRADEIAKSRGF